VRLAPRNGAATRVALAFLLGSALLSYAVLALGLVEGLQPIPMLGLLAALAIPVLRDRRRIGEHLATMAADLGAAYRRSPGPERALIMLAATLTGLGLLNPLLPVTSADALAYATAVPARFAQDGRIQFYPDSYESAFVLLNETLHAIGYTLGARPTGAWFEVPRRFSSSSPPPTATGRSGRTMGATRRMSSERRCCSCLSCSSCPSWSRRT